MLGMGISIAVLAVLASAGAASAKVHQYRAENETNWNGMLRSDIPPVLTVDDGDTVVFNTQMLMEGKMRADMTIEEIAILMEDLAAQGKGLYNFTGPFYVNGAEPGDVMEIRVKRIELGDYGMTLIFPGAMGMGALPELSPAGCCVTHRYSADKKSLEFKPGIEIPLRPFLGTMGLAPRAGEEYPPMPPGYYAGNMDNKELVAGTTLYVPVNVPGGLFMAADAHAVQGDGEVCVSASETWFNEVEIEFVVRKDLKLSSPLAETATHWIAMAFHEDLNQAAKDATRSAVDFLAATQPLTSEEAYLLCSLAVDFRITQIVDGVKGVHAMIPKAIFKK